MVITRTMGPVVSGHIVVIMGAVVSGHIVIISRNMGPVVCGLMYSCYY